MATTREIRAVLLVGFGAPARLDDVPAYLERLVEGRAVGRERLDEVLSHYEAVGGSPYNHGVRLQAKALGLALSERGWKLPVYVGMRNWSPMLGDTIAAMACDGVRLAATILLAPQQGRTSTGRYMEALEEALAAVGKRAPTLVAVAPWCERPGFIQAIVERVGEAFAPGDAALRARTAWIFTAHSIPLPAALGTPYVDQYRATVSHVAGELGIEAPRIAYQSRSGRPEDPWLEPDVCDVIRQVAGAGLSRVVVTPLGFVNEHVEVLYDLDIQARAIAQELGLEMYRTKTVGTHPRFISMLADLVEEALSEQGGVSRA